jgi:hypothetical protein
VVRGPQKAEAKTVIAMPATIPTSKSEPSDLIGFWAAYTVMVVAGYAPWVRRFTSLCQQRCRHTWMVGCTTVVVVGMLAVPAWAVAQGSVNVPPSLPALEQKMAQIRFNTARVSVRFGFGELGTAGSGAELGSGTTGLDSFLTSATLAVRLSPPASVSTTRTEGPKLPGGHTLGGNTSTERTIGKTIYTYKPSVASYDGGRPWVRSKAKPAPKPIGDSAKFAAVIDSLSPTFAGGTAGLFSKLINELGEAQSVQEVGPATVDRQQVTEFTASVPLARLLSPTQLEAITKTSSSLGELLSPTGSPKQQEEAKRRSEEAAKKLSEASVELELFIAPSGLPVRTVSVLGERNEGIGVEEDILALGIPVIVHTPPARETIGEAQLRKLERKHRGPICGLISVHSAPNTQPAICPRKSSRGRIRR